MKIIASGILLSSVVLSGQAFAAQEKVELTQLHFQTTPNGLRDIEGFGHNKTGKTLKNVWVTFSLLKNNVVIGQTISTASNLEAGQKFAIAAPFNSFTLKPDSFEVTGISVTD